MTDIRDTSRSTHPTSIGAVTRSLVRLGSRARLILLSQRLTILLAIMLGAILALGASDYFLRLPTALRSIQLILGAGLVAAALWRWIAPAARLRPALASLALRVEQQRPDLAGALASGVELAADASLKEHGSAVERSLAHHAVADVESRFHAVDLRGMLRVKGLVLAVCALVIVTAGMALTTASRPDLASIGVQRILTPWSGAHWPKRTDVQDVTLVTVHALGSSLSMRAALVRTNHEIEKTDVSVEHRAIRNGQAGAIHKELMTWQHRDIETASSARGELFERLIDVDADAVEYRFVTSDDQTDWRRVQLVDPPAVASAHAVLTPPDYASKIQDAGPLGQEVQVDLGTGADERAVAPPALSGSRVTLELVLNKVIPASPDDPSWLAATIGVDAVGAGVALTVDPASPNVWTLAWTLDDSVRLNVALFDEFGIESTNETVFRFESVQDRSASATITEPPSDMTVLATAVVQVVGEGRDDVGLDAVWIDRQPARPAGAPGAEPSGPGGAIEPVAEPVEIARMSASGAPSLEVKVSLDLAPLGLRPGDQLWLTAVADDVYAMGSRAHDPTRSTPRVLYIISEKDFVSEVRSELSSIRQGAIRLHDAQQALRQAPDEKRTNEQADRGQAQLTQRIARLGEQLDAVKQRVGDNALNDRQLDNVLDDAQQFLDEAGQQSSNASDRLDEAQEAKEAQQNEQAEAREQQLDDAQQRVQDELAGLAELLDAGEDAWVMRRELEELASQQRQLQEQTAQAGAQTAGKAADELNEQERSELERIVDKQLELAQKAQDLAEELEDRARELEEHDPAAAAGMRQAARRAKESQVAQTMKEAAEQAQQNQMSKAGEQQEQAAEDLEEMLNDLDQAEQSREEILRRVLASLIESLEALIAQQRTQINALADAADRDNFAGLDQAMVRLNQNTLGALDQASAAGREVAPVADLIGRAVEAQTQAILALRADPIDPTQADKSERRSLEFLQQARDQAEKVDDQIEQRQQDRARNELRQAYRQALEEQVAVRADTLALAQFDQLNRRQRAGAHKLAQQQREIQALLQELLEKSDDLSDASIFEYAHRRLDELAERSALSLGDGQPRAAGAPQNTAVAILQGLVEALRQSDPPPDDFSKGGGGGGGGGGSGGGQNELIPPIAELRLLKAIQTDLAGRTRAVDDAGGGSDQAQSLGDEQHELGELGQDLVRRLSEQQQQPKPIPTTQEPPK